MCACISACTYVETQTKTYKKMLSNLYYMYIINILAHYDRKQNIPKHTTNACLSLVHDL